MTSKQIIDKYLTKILAENFEFQKEYLIDETLIVVLSFEDKHSITAQARGDSNFKRLVIALGNIEGNRDKAVPTTESLIYNFNWSFES